MCKRIGRLWLVLLVIVLAISSLQPVLAQETFYFSDSPNFIENNEQKTYSAIEVTHLGTDNLFSSGEFDYTRVFTPVSETGTITYTLGNIQEMSLELYYINPKGVTAEGILEFLTVSAGEREVELIETNAEETVGKAVLTVDNIQEDSITLTLDRQVRITQVNITHMEKPAPLNTLEKQEIEQQKRKEEEANRPKEEKSVKEEKTAKKKAKKATSFDSEKNNTSAQAAPKEEAPANGNHFVRRTNRWVYIVGFIACLLTAIYATRLYYQQKQKRNVRGFAITLKGEDPKVLSPLHYLKNTRAKSTNTLTDEEKRKSKKSS